MIEYINAVKRALRDQHGFKPTGGTEQEPLFADGTVPDGEYPCKINGKTDNVKLSNGRIHCCRFGE